MDDLEATLASLFRVSCSSSASIVVEIGANFGNLLYYFALVLTLVVVARSLSERRLESVKVQNKPTST